MTKHIRNELEYLSYVIIQEYRVGPYYVDLYVRDTNLIIEINGLYHYSGAQSKPNAGSTLKQKVLEKQGYSYTDICIQEFYSKKNRFLRKDIIDKALTKGQR